MALADGGRWRPRAVRTSRSMAEHSLLYISFMSGLRNTQCTSCCMHSSHIATLASEVRSLF